MHNIKPQTVPATNNLLIKKQLEKAGSILLGKERVLKLALSCLIAKGHLLIEDVPGVGKTILAQTLARLFDFKFQRIQFTSDLLPTDITGYNFFDKQTNTFTFRPGPLFTQCLLADEVNRATPRAQSALLEAMEESQVTIDGKRYNLKTPFFVIATQNPGQQIGTYPLPESQMDRFLMRIPVGYPNANEERNLLIGKDRRILLANMTSTLKPSDLESLQEQATHIKVSEPLLAYLQNLVHFTRKNEEIETGLSPRASIALLKVAKAWCLICGERYVLPEHLQAVFPYVSNHRLYSEDVNQAVRKVNQLILGRVSIP